MEEEERLEVDLSHRLFRSEQTREKYRKFIRVTKIRSQPKKRKTGDADDQQTVKVAVCECLTCGKEFVTYFGSATSTILRHLKRTHGIEKRDIENRYDEYEEEQIPQERFNRPSTLIVISNGNSKIVPAKPAREKQLCRLCARHATSNQPIFSIYNGRLLKDLISNVCTINIELNDSLPKQICDECLEIVVSANVLRETSLLSDIKFRSGNFPEETITVKEEYRDVAMQFEDEEPIEHPKACPSQSFSNDSVWQCDDSNFRRQREGRQASSRLRKIEDNRKCIASQSQRFECDLCAENFIHRTSIEQHMKSLHSNVRIVEPLPLNCEVSFSLQKSIKGHIKNLHKPDKKFCSDKSRLRHERLNTCRRAPSIPELPICHICGKTTQSATAMRTHIRTHEDSKDYHCTQCPANFTSKRGLERHHTVHSKDRPHSCDICGNTFKDERSLRKHGLSIHDKIRNNACEFCDKKFFTSFSLKQHVRTHTGEKPFMCKFCDMAYAQNADLLRHLRRAHVGDAIYECTIDGCTESFRLKSERLEHYEVHYQNEQSS